MALSGSVKTNAYDGRYYEVTWSATQSIPNNKSRISWSLKALGGSAGWYAERTLKLTIAGDTLVNKTDRVERKAGEITAGWVDVSHDANGNASFNINIQVAVYDSAVNCTASKDITLDTIARATVPSVDKNSLDFGAIIHISMPRKSTNFKHTLKYTFGGVTGTIATDVDTDYRWVIPLDFMNRIPNATSGVITISCLTYNGSTLVGSKTINITANVPSSVIPNINGVSVVEATSGIKNKFGVFLTDQSSFDVEISAVGSYGSTISSYLTTFVGTTYKGSEFTVDSVNGSGTYKFSVTVKDSRGRTASYEHTIDVVDYVSPRIVSLNAFRCDEYGNQDDEGNYILIDYGHNISSVNNKNDKSYSLEIKASNDSGFTTIDSGSEYFVETYTIIEADIDESYIVKLTVSDYFTEITREIEAPTAFTLVDYHVSGKGISFGKVSEKTGAMEIGFTMYDKYETLIGNGIASYKASGSIDANTTLEALFISSTNTPDTNLWNVSQIFYQEKSDIASRAQYAIPYSYASQSARAGENRSHYRRNYIPGLGWGEWLEIPILIESGTSGVWTYEKWSNRKARIEGKIPVNSVAVKTALGAWYRSGQIYTATDYQYPFAFNVEPTVSAEFFTSNTNGALLWFLNEGYVIGPPTCYLIRPVTSDGVSGYVHIIAEGTF